MTTTTCSAAGFTVSPVNSTNGIVPAGTTYSWSAPSVAGITGAASGTAASDVNGALTNTTNAAINVVYSVTATSGSCVASSPFNVTVTVSPRPAVTAMTSTTCSGTGFTVTPVNSTDGIVPTGTTYSWSAPSVAGITGTAGGSAATNISGNLTNTTNAAIDVVYSVTATSGSCVASAPFNVTVTVSPRPAVTAMTTTTCSGTGFTVSPVNSTNGIVPVGTTYSWFAPSVSGGMTGGAPGSGTDINGTLTNPFNTSQTANYTVTPTSGSCTGSTFTVTVTVSPRPAVTAMTATSCSAAAFTVSPANITNGLVPSGTTYSWSAPSVAGITGEASGSAAPSITGTLTNTTTAPIDVAYTLTPTAGSCIGSTFTVTVTVNPLPTASATPSNPTICSASGSGIVLSSNTTGGTNSWSWIGTNNTTTTGASNSSGGTINQTLSNSGVVNSTATYVITPTFTNNSVACSGSTLTQTVTVNPVSNGGTLSGGTSPICFASSTGTITLSGNVGTVVKWQKSLNGGAYSDIVNTTNTLSETPTSAGTWTYRAVVQSGVCATANSGTRSIVVDPTSVGGTITGQGVVCIGQIVNLTLTGQTGAVVQWEVSSAGVGGPFTAISGTGGVSAYSPPTGVLGSKWYRVMVKSGQCASTYSATIPFVTAVYCLHTWTGAVNQNWHHANNWIPNTVPTFGDPVLIPDVALDPIIGFLGNNYAGSCDSLTILSGATLGFYGNSSISSLTVYGDIVNLANNNIYGGGVVKFGATSPSNVTITGGAMFNNDRVEIVAGSTLKLMGSSDFVINKAIRVNTGSTVYSYGSNGATAQLRFIGNPLGANYTALIDYNSGAALGNILGEVTSEKAIHSGNFGYKYLSSPVQNRLDQWIDDFSITGANNWSSSVYTNPWPTVWIYNEPLHGASQSAGWKSFTNTAANFSFGTGYAAITPPNPTIDLTGLLMVQTSASANTDQTKAVTKTSSGGALVDGWNLLGNPFIAPLDWNSVYAANSSILTSTLYRWVGSGNYGGSYATYNASIGLGTPSYVNSRISTQQGFLVHATASGNVTLNRAMTNGNPNNPDTYMKEGEDNVGELPIIRLGIFDNEENMVDECVAAMHPQATDQAGDTYDSEKMFNNDFVGIPEIYLTNQNNSGWKTAINALPAFGENVVIPVGLTSTGVFNVKVNELANIPSDINVYFEDAKVKTTVKLKQNDLLVLTKSDGDNSEGRYFLRFGKNEDASSAEDNQRIGYTYVEANVIKIRLFNAGVNASSANVFDITGKLISKADLTNTNGVNSLQGLSLAPGVYIVTVKSDKGNFNDRVVIE